MLPFSARQTLSSDFFRSDPLSPVGSVSLTGGTPIAVGLPPALGVTAKTRPERARNRLTMVGKFAETFRAVAAENRK